MKQFVKKTLAMLVAVMMLCALSVAAYAEEPNGRGQSVGFVDEDGDGVCDNFGFGRGSGQRRGQGAGFVDEDGDGVCDYFGIGRRDGQGRGNRAGFVDEDGDGVCDYFGTGRGSGQGRGQRNR